MDLKQEEFLKRLQATFRVEAEEHIRTIAAGLIELEKAPEGSRGPDVVETIFRAAHSLKGAARSVSLTSIEPLCQALESIFAAMKRREIALSAVMYDLAHRALDEISRLVASPEAARSPAERSRGEEIIRQLEKAAQKAAQAAVPRELNPLARGTTAETASPQTAEENVPAALQPPSAGKFLPLDTVRIPVSRLEPLLLQAEEMIPARLAAGQRVADLKEINRALAAWKAELARWKQRTSAAGEPLGFEILEWNETRLAALQDQAAAATRALEQGFHNLSRMVDDHLAAIKSVLMLPVSSLVEGFPKLVRDLAREQGKEVELVLRGVEMEMDKRVLEELKDPLIHLLRNGVDHGIEKPEERIRRNKPPHGTLSVSFEAKESRQAEIVISDDGAGVDLDRVRLAAEKAGILSPDAPEPLDPRTIMSLIFQSGLTTSSILTDVSGRGLGLAIVRERVEKLGGVVSLSSQPGAGTTFRLLLPLTLSTFKGILVRAQDQVFVLPAVNVVRSVRVRLKEILTVENRAAIRLDGQILSLVKLSDALGLSASPVEARTAAVDYAQVLVLNSAETRIAVQVDDVLDEQEVLVKSLGGQLRRVANIAGATILGSGQVAPVLNVADLMKSAARPLAAARAAVENLPEKPGRILLAEDSITARSLLKNILETAGYQVAAAVDGVDAFTRLRAGEFDLVVSDVDMPRMSGFELTAKIRGDKKYGELPVVLVTALESREDRERGIEAGANAYIVKSSFEQSNLLEVIRRLI